MARYLSIIYNIFGIIFSLFARNIIDRKGQRVLWLIFSTFLITFAFAMKFIIVLNRKADFALKLSLIFIAMIILGIGAALQYVAVLSTTIVICKEKYYGIFLGALTAAKNVLNFVLTISFEPSLPSDNSKSTHVDEDEISTYEYLIFYCFVLNCVCVIAFVFLQIYDQNHKMNRLSYVMPQEES